MKNQINLNAKLVEINALFDTMVEGTFNYTEGRAALISEALTRHDNVTLHTRTDNRYHVNCDHAAELLTQHCSHQITKQGLEIVYERERGAVRVLNGKKFAIQGDEIKLYFKISKRAGKVTYNCDIKAFPKGKARGKNSNEKVDVTPEANQPSVPSTVKSGKAAAPAKITTGALRDQAKSMSTVEKQEMLTILFDAMPAKTKTALLTKWTAKLHFLLRKMTAAQIKKAS